MNSKRSVFSARAMDDDPINDMVENNNVRMSNAKRTKHSARAMDDPINDIVQEDNVRMSNAKRTKHSARAMDDPINDMVEGNNNMNTGHSMNDNDKVLADNNNVSWSNVIRTRNSTREMDDINNFVLGNNNVSGNIANRTRSSARVMDDDQPLPAHASPPLQPDPSPCAEPIIAQANVQTASPNGSGAGSSSFVPCGLNTRGFARPHFTWGTTQKLELQFNKYMIPIGPNRKKLASQLGVLARNGIMLPLTFTDWRTKAFKPYHIRCWNEIKDNTNLPEACRHKCLKDLAKKWNNWKANVGRKYYLAFETDEERLANCPPRVQPDQWPKLVKYWGRPEVNEKCRKNKLNRRRQVGLHRSGRKAHVQVAEELKAQGKRHDRVAVYIATHRKKSSGEPSDTASGENIARMEEQLSQATPEDQASDAFRESVFVEVMGPDRGRVRTMGSGPCPSEVFGSRYGNVASPHDMKRIRGEIRDEIREELREEIRNEMRGELRSELRNELREEMNELMMEQMRAMETRLRETRAFPSQTPVADPEPVQQTTSARVQVVHPRAPLAPQHVQQATSSARVQPRAPLAPQPAQQGTSSNNSHSGVRNQAKNVPPRVELLSLGQKREVVAQGFLISNNAQKVVNGEPLGAGYWEVRVQKVLKPECKLFKPKKPLLTLGDAEKKFIAWPAYLVQKLE